MNTAQKAIFQFISPHYGEQIAIQVSRKVPHHFDADFQGIEVQLDKAANEAKALKDLEISRLESEEAELTAKLGEIQRRMGLLTRMGLLRNE